MKTTRYVFCFLLVLCGAVSAQDWVGTWAASPQLVEPKNSLAGDDLRDATLRQIVHPTLSGSRLVLRLTNRAGTAPLHIGSVHIARAVSAGNSKIVAGSDKAVTFSGASDVTISEGADYLSDPVNFPVTALSDLSITMHFDSIPAEQSGHPGSRTTSFLVHGDQVSALEFTAPKKVEHWYFIEGIDVASDSAAAIATLGDSITDGHGATTDGNDRWPDVLAARLQGNAATRNVAVLNHGIGGNRVLADTIGPNALSRFDHDVLAQSGIRWLIVLEGINDLGRLTRDGEVSQAAHDEFTRRLIAGHEQIIRRAHLHGIKVIGATVLPFVGNTYYHPGPLTEADRQKLNQWIRAPGHFDAVVDFDQVTRDPAQPDRMLAAFDSGDHLHPSPAGYAAMAGSIPLALFATPAGQARKKIAFTFDDLPAHGPLPPGETRVAVIKKIIAALHAAHVPPTYGFVNGRLLEQTPADTAVLQTWREAGNPLGNHAWSHMNLNQHSVEEFDTDVERNEPLLAEWMKNENWHWFRYPFLSEGDTPEKREAARKFLSQHGYKVAAVTMSFGDYLWPETYARCLAKEDSHAVQTLKDAYLKAADDNLGYAHDASQLLLGRDIPFVLLMHVGASTADMLPSLLELFRSRGYEFVSLEEAEQDEFYRWDTEVNTPHVPDTFEGLARERHAALPAHPDVQLDFAKLCR